MEGLEYLHSCKPPIVHSNIKSDNIFVNANTNEIKLGEVGFLATTLDSCKSLYGRPLRLGRKPGMSYTVACIGTHRSCC
jgi:WNK lysine deficient protein kinase